jgi:hypothetical protein
MRSDDVVRAFVAALEADAALVALIGLGGDGTPNIYRAGANRDPQIPSVEWRRITDRAAENTEPMLFQFDVWARGYAAAMAIEHRIRRVLLPYGDSGAVTLDGLPMLAELDDSRDHEDPEPGVVHTSLDIRFEPAKQVI